jgi:DNA-binding response OmpR family regulator
MQYRINDCKILLIDDEVELLKLMETVLKKEGFQRIYQATTGADGVALAREEQPDLIVLDIMLPDTDGFEVCRKLREFTFAPIIFLSARSEDVDKILGLGIGGDDYVTKPFSPKEVAFRVKAQLRRKTYFEQEQKEMPLVITVGDLAIDEEKAEVRKGRQLLALTAKEYQILLYMAKHPNQILSKQKICDAVWGDEYEGYDNTIMVHMRRLREKVETDPSHPNHIITVKGLGYKLAKRDEVR